MLPPRHALQDVLDRLGRGEPAWDAAMEALFTSGGDGTIYDAGPVGIRAVATRVTIRSVRIR